MKARKVSDLLKPKPDLDIMSELLETEPEHIQVMLSIYNKWNPIFKGEINKPELSSIGDKIRAFKRDLEIEQDKIKDTGYRNEGSTGFRGLLRLIGWWESHRYSTEMLEEMIDQWMKTVEVSLKHFKKMAKREYHPIKEDTTNIFKPKPQEEFLPLINDKFPIFLEVYNTLFSDYKFNVYKDPANRINVSCEFDTKYFTIWFHQDDEEEYPRIDMGAYRKETPRVFTPYKIVQDVKDASDFIDMVYDIEKQIIDIKKTRPYNVHSITINELSNIFSKYPQYFSDRNVKDLVYFFRSFGHHKYVNEAIGDILKPKSEEEIKKEIRKLSGDDLWDLWKDTGQKEYLRYALKKRITFRIGSEDIADAIQEFPDAAETLFPLIVQNFPYNLKKEGQKYFLYADWYDEFADLFMESNDLSSESIQKILSGDSWDLFERYGSENMNLTDEIYSIQKMEKNKGVAYFKSLTEELVTKLLEYFDWFNYDNTMEIKNLKTLTDVAKFLVKYQNERELDEFVEAFEKALNETRGVADEAQAFNELKNSLENELGFKFDKKYYSESDKCYKIPLSKDSIIQLFKKAMIDDEKIKYNAPYYGYQGNIYDHPDVFNDSLSNSISEIDEG